MMPNSIAGHSLSSLRGWDAFNTASSQGTIFSSKQWLETVAPLIDASLTVYAATSGEELICAVPLLIRSRLGQRIATAHPFLPYNGVLLSPGLLKESDTHETVTKVLKEVCGQTGYVSLSLHPSINDLRPFMWEHWQVQKLYTYWVDITGEETLWNNYSQSLRRKIRRAHDDGINVREHADANLIAEQYLYSYSRHGIHEPIPVAKVLEWAQTMLSAGLVRMFVAEDINGNSLASRLVAPDHPFVYDWLAGSSPDGDSSSANHTLVDGILKTFAREGFSTFDFRGANAPGVIDFKRSFGGLLMSYAQATYQGSWILATAEQIRNVYTRMRRGIK